MGSSQCSKKSTAPRRVRPSAASSSNITDVSVVFFRVFKVWQSFFGISDRSSGDCSILSATKTPETLAQDAKPTDVRCKGFQRLIELAPRLVPAGRVRCRVGLQPIVRG